MKKLIRYFIPSNIDDNIDAHRKASLTIIVFFIIAGFNIFYTTISYIIDFPGGILSQLPLLCVTVVCLFLYKYGITPVYIYTFYFIFCIFSIAVVVYYTGGFLSLLFSWLAPTPLVALLVWSKRGAVLTLLVLIIVEILLFVLYSYGYLFPDQIGLQYQKFFYLTTNLGLPLLLFWIAYEFETSKSKAFNKLQAALNALGVEKQRSDDLLLNILPEEVALELKENGKATARQFDHVSILFTDFVNFTSASEIMNSQELVSELDFLFRSFDGIVDKYSIEKIKTIGDAYLAVSGLPQATENHVVQIASAAIEIKDFVHKRKKRLGDKTFDIRIGIHTGSVVAGIVGVKKYAYDIWGDAVNTAARMEQSGETGKINISETTYHLLKNRYKCIDRGEIEAKKKGLMNMYFLEGPLNT